jgi:hypothetical protein
MPDSPASGQSGTINDDGICLVPDSANAVRHSFGPVRRYLTKTMEAGMPMPASVFSMLMPSYAKRHHPPIQNHVLLIG